MRRFAVVACVALLTVLLGRIPAAGQSDGAKYGAFTYDTGLDNDPSVGTRCITKGNDSMLAFGCEGQGVAIIYMDLQQGGSRGTSLFTVTFTPADSAPAKPWKWENWLAGVPDDDIQAFTKQALKSSKVTLRFENTGKEARVSEFSLEGLSEALPKLPCAAKFLGK